ncbi:GNAT family N-acetyltransferase [Streptomyces sp. NRRL B-1677]|uniref:GNAT family N-acetyltransferase n=1 Tax=Streptomyces klenkii TaxID=1420899 RepID=A0A3B0BV01_9ACTN|nr:MULTISPECIES: GNAT family N-acetyltransferase [Streptomyces]MBF6047253.1 GNAT family N-acetyltransferase [Streptomyces sp. NRRL B-1677]RKN77235.1 GNAT family N-acetyltransferase [Streptomyces klenkii]
MNSANDDDRRELPARIEQYYDAVPRSGARAEDFGPLTLFVREGRGWPFYARPALGWSGPVSAGNVARVRARQRELGIPESFEWVAETTPALRAAAEEAGLTVHEHPLMALGPDAPPLALPEPAAGLELRIVGPEDPVLPSALAVPHLAFADPGTRTGTAGTAELREATRAVAADGSVEQMAARIRAGLTCVAAVVEDGLALCSGQHQPVGPVSEIVAVGTLPAARRRGLGQAVTAALLADARSRGAGTVFLSAGDEDVARIYGRLGFRRVATALIAEPPAGE